MSEEEIAAFKAPILATRFGVFRMQALPSP